MLELLAYLTISFIIAYIIMSNYLNNGHIFKFRKDKAISYSASHEDVQSLESRDLELKIKIAKLEREIFSGTGKHG